jgi:hypothetical protein
MPSSTSNSNQIQRMIPNQNWIKLALLATLLTTAFTVGWEIFWRVKGYSPSLNDNKDLWALTRGKINSHSKTTVIIGSSRSLFGFNLYEWEKAFGTIPVQLATVATNPNVYLNHLANETDFSGTLIIDIVPGIFFAPEGAPIDIPTGNLRHYETFSYAQKWSHALSIPLEKNFAFLETEDLSLKNLMKEIPFKNRANAQVPPPVPPFFMEIDDNRQGSMISRVETDLKFQTKIKDIWVNYFTPPPPAPGVSMESHLAAFGKHMEQVLYNAQKNVARIQSRGGKVIMVAFPSTGRVLHLENQYTPRSLFWDRIVREVKPDFSIYYNDYEELKGFDCPEESHLRPKDAVRFTQGLIKIIGKELPGYQ